MITEKKLYLIRMAGYIEGMSAIISHREAALLLLHVAAKIVKLSGPGLHTQESKDEIVNDLKEIQKIQELNQRDRFAVQKLVVIFMGI